MTSIHDMSKVDKSLDISDKIVRLLEDEKLDFNHSIYSVMSTLLYLHYGKTHSMMNKCLNENVDPSYFLEYLRNDFKRCEGLAENILDKVSKLDNHMVLDYFEQKRIRYQKLSK